MRVILLFALRFVVMWHVGCHVMSCDVPTVSAKRIQPTMQAAVAHLDSASNPEAIGIAMQNGFMDLDEQLRQMPAFKRYALTECTRTRFPYSWGWLRRCI